MASRKKPQTNFGAREPQPVLRPLTRNSPGMTAVRIPMAPLSPNTVDELTRNEERNKMSFFPLIRRDGKLIPAMFNQNPVQVSYDKTEPILKLSPKQREPEQIDVESIVEENYAGSPERPEEQVNVLSYEPEQEYTSPVATYLSPPGSPVYQSPKITSPIMQQMSPYISPAQQIFSPLPPQLSPESVELVPAYRSQHNYPGYWTDGRELFFRDQRLGPEYGYYDFVKPINQYTNIPQPLNPAYIYRHQDVALQNVPSSSEDIFPKVVDLENDTFITVKKGLNMEDILPQILREIVEESDAKYEITEVTVKKTTLKKK